MHSYLHVVVNHDGHCVTREFNELPRLCPLCQQRGQPFRLAARATEPNDASVDFAFQCARPSCRRIFVASYHRGPYGVYELDRVGAERWQQQVLTVHV